jgi:hypothetical protein
MVIGLAKDLAKGQKRQHRDQGKDQQIGACPEFCV